MKPLSLFEEAWALAWRNRAMWVFGFFLAGLVGTAGWTIDLNAELFSIAGWTLRLALVLAKVISQGAAIDGVRRGCAGEPIRVAAGVRIGVARVLRLVGIRLVIEAAFLVALGLLVLPALVHFFGGPSIGWLTLMLALPGVPFLLTLRFIGEYAQRIAVVDDLGIRQALRDARRHLSGRLRDSLHLLLTATLGDWAGSLLALTVYVPALFAWLVVGSGLGTLMAVLATPVFFALVSITGAFHSTVWTLGFLHGREAGRA